MTEQLTLMTVHAHPDDEIFSTGGSLATYADRGVRTVLVTCTGGEEGEIVDPTMDQEQIRPRLKEVREEELRCSADLLGVCNLELLGYRDSGMAGTPSNQDPASFNMASPEEATGRLVRLVRRYRPQVLVSYDENGSYGHPDHIKAHLITGLAFDAAGDAARYPDAGPAWQPQKLYYCGISTGQRERWAKAAQAAGIEVPWLNQPQENEPPRGLSQERITTIVKVEEYIDRKLAAFRCHRTQIRADSFFFQLPLEVARNAYSDEQFIRVRSLVEAAVPEHDLFAGIRG